MTFPSYSDSPGSPTKYLGQSYRFAPVFIRQRDPANGTDGTPFTSPDIRPKENQGYYPVGSFWINKTLNRLWSCTSFGVDANSHTCAHWELIESSGITGVEQFLLPDASTITPTGIPPKVTFQNGAGISITQGTDLHTIEITATGAGTETITGDDGIAVSPTLGTIQVLGKVVANATHAKAVFTETSGAANQENIDVQVSAAIGATDVTKVGLAAFSNAQFGVDANGFVTLSGGTTAPVLGVTPDAHTAPGTTPVVPNGSGNIIIEGGATFATNTQANPIRTNSLAANTVDLQIQLAGSNAGASSANKFGVSQFDSNQFTVTNGFVQLAGGTTAAIEKVNVQTGTSPIVPSSSAITINGAVVAAGTNPVRTDGTGANTMAVEVQTTQAIAATDATKIGLAAFNSAQFGVDANGFVTLVNGSNITGLVPDSFTPPGTSPVVPNGSGNIIVTSGSNYTTGTTANSIRTTSLAANTLDIEVQLAGSNPTVSTPNNFGVAQFNSTQFGVSAGYVTSNNFTITAGPGLTGGGTITLGGSVTLTATGAGFAWTDEGVNFNASVNNGYFVTAIATATLPPSPSQGDIIRFVVDTTSVLTIAANTGQSIRIGNAISSVAGSISSTKRGDSVDLVYRATGTTWFAFSGIQGSWTIT